MFPKLSHFFIDFRLLNYGPDLSESHKFGGKIAPTLPKIPMISNKRFHSRHEAGPGKEVHHGQGQGQAKSGGGVVSELLRSGVRMPESPRTS